MNFCRNNRIALNIIKNLPCGDFFILFKTNLLKTNLKLSVNIIWKPENSFYICNRLEQYAIGEILKRPTRADCKSAV